MLIPYMALAQGTSTIKAKRIAEHLDANMWLMEKMLNVKFHVQKVNTLYQIQKVG
jgi:RNA 3'-terminal phosphate cyclase